MSTLCCSPQVGVDRSWCSARPSKPVGLREQRDRWVRFPCTPAILFMLVGIVGSGAHFQGADPPGGPFFLFAKSRG